MTTDTLCLTPTALRPAAGHQDADMPQSIQAADREDRRARAHRRPRLAALGCRCIAGAILGK
jgi:hypothetical protein